MSDMKEVNAREFQKAFSKLTTELPQGQTIAITKKGKPLGFFTKASNSPPQPVRMPDFAANLESMPYDSKVAQDIVRCVLDETLS